MYINVSERLVDYLRAGAGGAQSKAVGLSCVQFFEQPLRPESSLVLWSCAFGPALSAIEPHLAGSS